MWKWRRAYENRYFAAGAHDAYNIGDKVTHNGKTWVSDVDNNVWEPGVYGWKCINGG